MSSRTVAVLERFPGHLGLTDPGKRAGVVVDGLAAPIDVLTRQVGDVRVAHRLGDAPSTGDLLKLAALHAFGPSAVDIVRRRIDALTAAGRAEPIDLAAVAQLVNVLDELLAELGDDLADVVAGPGRQPGRLAVERATVVGAIGALRIGNGTPAAILRAAAAYLGLVVDEVVHTDERWWHLARGHDGIALVAPAAGPDGPEPPALIPGPEYLALEENPFRSADIDPAPRRHGTRFGVLRGGLEDVPVAVRVAGIGTRTVRPMVVHLDTGRGLVYEGDVPDGEELVFTTSGQVTLGGATVTGMAWAFAGGVFASGPEPLLFKDFVFASADSPDAEQPEGPTATFAISTPVADAFGPSPLLPHGAAAVDVMQLPLGQSRWASFVRVGHAGADVGQPAVPRTSGAFFDGSVFAGGSDPTDPAPPDPSLAVGFAWEERQPFAVRVLLPPRLAAVDDEAGTLLREPLRALLDRHRAAGISLRVEYADPRWTLGVGVVRDTADDPLGVVVAGTGLWTDDTPQPTPL